MIIYNNLAWPLQSQNFRGRTADLQLTASHTPPLQDTHHLGKRTRAVHMFGLDITSLYTSKDSEPGPRAMIYMICRGTNRARQSLRCSDINERFLNRIASMINQHTCRTSHKSYQFIHCLLSEILNLTSPMYQVFHYALFTFHIHNFILQSSLIASITSRQLVRRRR